MAGVFWFKSVLKQTLCLSIRKELKLQRKINAALLSTTSPLHRTSITRRRKGTTLLGAAHEVREKSSLLPKAEQRQTFPFFLFFLWLPPRRLPGRVFQLLAQEHPEQTLTHCWMRPCLSMAGEKTAKLSSKVTREAAAAPGSHGNNNFYGLEAEISEGNKANCGSQVREGDPNGTGLSFKAKCYCRHAWTWLSHPLKGHNNDSHIPARGNKAKQEFCLHKM